MPLKQRLENRITGKNKKQFEFMTFSDLTFAKTSLQHSKSFDFLK